MNREDCEKLLDAFENASAMSRLGTSESIMYAKDARDNLRDVIIGIMADGKKPAYRDGGFPRAVPNMPSIPNMNTVICDCKED